MRPPRLLLLLVAACAFFAGGLRAEEPFFKKGDVIAIVGGEDMVALSEYGYLELLLTRALPDYHLRFRNLAQEGDTVFEQRRDLNFPTWEEALAKIGATVVLCQFGQMESLAGKEKLPEFIAAYEKLFGRLSGGGKRRVVLVSATPFETQTKQALADHNPEVAAYWAAAKGLAMKHATESIDLFVKVRVGHESEVLTRDSVHLNPAGLWLAARHSITQLAQIGVDPKIDRPEELERPSPNSLFAANAGVGRASEKGDLTPGKFETLRQLIIAKNRLWFDYWRVQNWAFLAGDRTNQPSSRDHLDPARRWFPEERERFLPLIEAKERAIDALAAKLATNASQ